MERRLGGASKTLKEPMMAKNYVGEGDVLEYAAGGAAVASGAVVVMGARIGVALSDIAAGSVGSVSVKTVWMLPKLSTDDVAQGELLYWDAVNNRLTTTAGANVLAGYAASAAGAGVATVSIHINA